MRYFALLCCAALMTGCAERQEDASMEGEAGAMAEMVSLADYAGTWNVRALNEAGDSVLVEYQMTATDGMDGWMVMFPEREPMPMRVVSHAGDSVVTEIGPYESLFRPGVMVTTRSVTRLEGGAMVGTFVATYDTEAADSILRGQAQGTRVQ